MTREQFKIIHSELIMCCQFIEFDLKRIYSAMSTGDFDENMDMFETSNFGSVLKELKRLDNSDGNPYLSKADYKLLDNVREMRNYWVHQCYIDFAYINDSFRKEQVFSQLSNRLWEEHDKIADLHHKLETFYFDKFE